MIPAWRLIKSRYGTTAFDGEGAELHGGRWNSPGVRVAYASDSVALAALEVLANLQSTALLASYAVASLRFPEELIEDLEIAKLPSTWRRFPVPPGIQALGDRWARELRSAILRVPSVIIPSARNFLVNPAHPDFGRVVIDPTVPFEWDPRLFKSRAEPRVRSSERGR